MPNLQIMKLRQSEGKQFAQGRPTVNGGAWIWTHGVSESGSERFTTAVTCPFISNWLPSHVQTFLGEAESFPSPLPEY